MTYNIVTSRQQQPQVIIDQAALQQLQTELARRISDLERLRVAIETLAQVNEPDRFAAAAMALCNHLAARWQAQRASLGFLKGRYVRLAALSHTEKFTRQMRLVQDIEASMEECLDQDLEILFPPAAQATYVMRSTEALSSRHGPSAICCLPLRRNGEVVAVVALERKADQPFAAGEIETLRLTCDLVTPRLVVLHKTDRWVGARMAQSLREGLSLAVGPKHTWIKAAAAAIFAVSAFALLFSGKYRVDSHFTLEAKEKETIPAPFDGFLKTVNVQPGDYVFSEESITKLQKVGDLAYPMPNPFTAPCFKSVLATLDTAELRNKLAQAQADRTTALIQADISWRDGKLAERQAKQAEADRAKAQIDLLEYQIGKAQVRSLIDGVVFEGDLKQKLGAPLKTGDTMFEVGQLEQLRAELTVPEDEASNLRVTQKGELASASYPGDKIKFKVDQITPVAELVDQKNVVKVRVTFDEKRDWMRPGLTGIAKVEVGKERYAWLWTHRVINYVRMKLWM